MFRVPLTVALLALGTGEALACSPLPAGTATRIYDEMARKTDMSTSSLVEIVIVEAATSPDTGAARVTKSFWGKLRAGAVLRLKPQPGSMCGPEAIRLGDKGLVRFSNSEIQQPAIAFHGFSKPEELRAYRRYGLLRD